MPLGQAPLSAGLVGVTDFSGDRLCAADGAG
jgi:hypothetical protein